MSDRATRWLVQYTFSLYLGWISVATLANAAIVLLHLGWTGGGISLVAWTVAMIVVAAGLAVTMALRRGDVIFGGVVTWALVGIAVQRG